MSTRADLEAALGGRRSAARVGLVPTMGALHEGHEALFAGARAAARSVVVSIFVNPLQFAPGEDLASYPRSLDDDLERCASSDVDVVFTPDVATVYPGGEPQVTIEPGPLARELEGASRPGHFRAVLTVVAKLFGLVRPDLAVFGTKDYQQLTLVRQCVRDLCMPVEILGVATVRAADGLALSSRNRYLTDLQREAALALSRALSRGQEDGFRGAAAVVSAARAVLDAAPDVSTDYLELRGVDLRPPPETGEARLLVAARVGPTRLIDNMAVVLGPQAQTSTREGA
ncbi:MAG: pantoate--beta-alanine ligase [Actinomycetota bacterium]|nr:pantoate--beta-alanine ligase [Actinomycetota bacterium]